MAAQFVEHAPSPQSCSRSAGRWFVTGVGGKVSKAQRALVAFPKPHLPTARSDLVTARPPYCTGIDAVKSGMERKLFVDISNGSAEQ